MERTKEEQKTIEQIVARLLASVKETEKKLGYIYWFHPEKKEVVKNA